MSDMGPTTDAINEVSRAARSIANAIRPLDTVPGHDVNGGTVDSLTEAVMGVSQSLQNIADAVTLLANVIERRGG